MKFLLPISLLLLVACGDTEPKSENNQNNGNNANNSNNQNNQNNATNNANNVNNVNNASAEFSSVAAILAENCGVDGCHGTPANKAYRIENGVDGSDQDVYTAIDNVIAATGRQLIEPGDRNESEIFLRITEGLGLPLMPQTGGPLSQADIDTIGSWIDNGANF